MLRKQELRARSQMKHLKLVEWKRGLDRASVDLDAWVRACAAESVLAVCKETSGERWVLVILAAQHGSDCPPDPCNKLQIGVEAV